MIASTKNEQVLKWVKLHQKKYREKFRQFIVEEKHLIQEAIMKNCLHTLLVLENSDVEINFKNTIIVSKQVMEKLSHHTSLNTMIGICDFVENKLESNRILLLDNIQIPGNMGTILRSAHVFGFQKIYLSKGCVDIYNEKVIQASQGAIFHLDIETVDLNEIVLQKKYPIYATGFQNAIALKNVVVSEKLGIIFGNEGSGVSKDLMKNADGIITIPQKQFDSLNVAIAASICMYELQV